ncbi:amidohydrolase family protein [Paratissierella segnis]|uniref:Amidohydrolase n=1 Tax=Paratissierella segnis TaxID=2763679 RepID=A0A926IJG7_9FIRM|nr:amidohydrolase family protein [Paratissierella segnis]MBC8588014.1 amidohydrolase [Paratissierella segnis]
MYKINDYHLHLGTSSSGATHTVEDLIAYMDKFNIERCGLSTINNVLTKPLNDIIAKCVAKYPDRIIGYGVINPREENAIYEVHRCLSELGLKGIKMHSWKHGYYPDNLKSLDAVIDAIKPYNVPILTHTGGTPLSMPSQWALVAEKHPKQIFVFAHIGMFNGGYSCVEYAKKLDNIYVDTSGQYELPILNKAIKELGSERILFGTDWPYKSAEAEMVKFNDLNLSEKDKEKIFRTNALKVWNLNK